MKKILAFLFVGVFVIFGLTGCGANKKFDYDKAVKFLDSNINNLEVVEDSSLKDVYGLDLDAMEKYTFKSNEDGDLYVIIKTSDVSGVKSQMNDYFEKVEKFNTNYSPERLEILNNRVSTQVNDYLIYIVSSEATELYDQMISEM